MIPGSLNTAIMGEADNITELLLNFNGTNGSTTFIDEGRNAYSPVANGDAQLTTVDPKFGTAALTIDGISDYVTIGSASDWQFLHDGSSPYTFECWFKADVLNAVMFLFGTCRLGASTGLFLNVNGSNGQQRIGMGVFNGGTPNINLASADLSMVTGTYYHFCFEFDPNKDVNAFNATLYFDGAIVAEQDITGTLPTGDPTHTAHIGARPEDTTLDEFDGRHDSMRVVKEIVYGGAFTPPTAELGVL